MDISQLSTEYITSDGDKLILDTREGSPTAGQWILATELNKGLNTKATNTKKANTTKTVTTKKATTKTTTSATLPFG
ncbi:hypothetical protein RsTz2092_06310 [Deferribacterales bacterium RsTz2092]